MRHVTDETRPPTKLFPAALIALALLAVPAAANDPLCYADKAKDDAERRLDAAKASCANYLNDWPDFDPEAKPALAKSEARAEKTRIEQFNKNHYGIPTLSVAEAQKKLRDFAYANSLPPMNDAELAAKIQVVANQITDLESRTSRLSEVKDLNREIGGIRTEIQAQMPTPDLQSPSSIEREARRDYSLSPPAEGIVFPVDSNAWNAFVSNELLPLINSRTFDNTEIRKARSALDLTVSNNGHLNDSDERDTVRAQLKVLEQKISVAQTAVRAKIGGYRTKLDRFSQLRGDDVLLDAKELETKRKEKSGLDGLQRNQLIVRKAENLERENELVKNIDWWETWFGWEPRMEERDEAKAELERAETTLEQLEGPKDATVTGARQAMNRADTWLDGAEQRFNEQWEARIAARRQTLQGRIDRYRAEVHEFYALRDKKGRTAAETQRARAMLARLRLEKAELLPLAAEFRAQRTLFERDRLGFSEEYQAAQQLLETETAAHAGSLKGHVNGLTKWKCIGEVKNLLEDLNLRIRRLENWSAPVSAFGAPMFIARLSSVPEPGEIEESDGFDELTERAAEAANNCDFDEAVKLGEQAAAINPNHEWVRDTLPRLREMQRSQSRARVRTQEHLSTFRNSPTKSNWDRLVSQLNAVKRDAPACEHQAIDDARRQVASLLKEEPEPYHIFVLTNASHGLHIDTKKSIRGRTRCSFEGGGVGCQPSDIVTWETLDGPFESEPEAKIALCRHITARFIYPLGIGLKGQWDNTEAWYGLWEESVTGECRDLGPGGSADASVAGPPVKDFAGAAAQGYFADARRQLEAKDVAGALRTYEQALDRDPNSAALNYNLSSLYQAQDQLLPAIEYGQRYLALAPNAFDRTTVQKRLTDMRQDLEENPRVQYDTTDCRDLYAWARREQAEVKARKDPARKQALLQVVISSQRGQCEEADTLARAYRQRYP